MSQLVDAHITIIDTMNGKKRDVAGVTSEFGVPPNLMIDYQTLVGDAVDNVPGVEKVGPKTAAKWLLEYGSLDALIERAAEVKGQAGENLRKALDKLPLSRQLVTIRTDCDLAAHVAGLPSLEGLPVGAPQTAELKPFYERFGFKSLVKSLEAMPNCSWAFRCSSAPRAGSHRPPRRSRCIRTSSGCLRSSTRCSAWPPTCARAATPASFAS